MMKICIVVWITKDITDNLLGSAWGCMHWLHISYCPSKILTPTNIVQLSTKPCTNVHVLIPIIFITPVDYFNKKSLPEFATDPLNMVTTYTTNCHDQWR
jgi:hypothetical protein